ncbi:MAG: aldehyde ferredoxin oxidoreductase N-terminal domain-containing protein [Phycisphaerae bacterium]|jgi:aldehyde:ferredoxin oxidoreductase|nr:aldehyde ferredoxin oxidoreductase N-terminal domain-containing protein [Phycisphaerae bacterium]
MNGYTGKILRLNLTRRKVSTIGTSKYRHWGGGHGIGSAIFFDLVKDKTIDGFDPANVVTLMTSPLCGTLVPAAGGRTEVQAIGVQYYPNWYTRSGIGGRISTQLKHAGWDGIVIEGKSDRPVWLDIRDDKVNIRDCKQLGLWGTDTRQCQQRIWKYVAGKGNYGNWIEPNAKSSRLTTQRPAVLTIGPAGENLSRMACLIHDAGNAAGQGGFGAVWGSKRLKAISIIGTGGIGIHDPKALLEMRLRHTRNVRQGAYVNTVFAKGKPRVPHRPQACVGCHGGCRGRYEDGVGNEVICAGSHFYKDAKTLDIQRKACDLLNKYGLNANEMFTGEIYLKDLHKKNALGADTGPECPLNFDDYGELSFARQLVKMIAYRNDGKGNPSQFGDDLGEGFIRAAKKWGRHEKIMEYLYPFWGIPFDEDPRHHLDSGFGGILGDRDINEHCFYKLGLNRKASPEEIARIYTSKMAPFQGDRKMLDFSDENMYSEHIAKLVSWHRWYTRFYKQSLLFCDSRWPDLLNPHMPDKVGSTGQAEPAFIHAVTGDRLSFADGIRIGRKIWNLDHAIWTLQGRHRDMVRFSDPMYLRPGRADPVLGLKDGKWQRLDVSKRRLDRAGFEKFKTRFYKLQGWDTATGYPTRATLESLKLGYVADELEKNGKLGAS